MLYVALAPEWLPKSEECPNESVQTPDLKEVLRLNDLGMNAYFYPNYPSKEPNGWVKSADIDKFEWVFVDMDLKEKVYASKEEFLKVIDIEPSHIVDSGNGIHVYWRTTDLDAMSFLRLQRRLARHYKTDLAVSKIKQLMRLEGTVNTKNPDAFKLCERIYETEAVYTAEQLDSLLPPISIEDEAYCKAHYEKSYAIKSSITVDDKLPAKFGKLLRDSKEAKEIWNGNVEDRSVADYRLGHLMSAAGFTKAEAMSVLVNSQKALSRAPVHRISYAENIVEKVWGHEEEPQKLSLSLSRSVKDILASPVNILEGTRFPCWKYLDDTEYGFRLGHVIGLVAGVGVGKTSMALNMFMGFVKLNPNFVHFFVPLEQPVEEIAKRWRKMCGGDTSLYDKVQLISNYDDDGSYRNLSLDEIKNYIIEFQKQTGKKAGACVIDHLAVLKMKGENGENQRIVDICHSLKSFAIQTNTLLVMQSQAPREKAGIGDLELDKDAAYGSMFFEAYTDYLITIWQPLKRCYAEGAPLVTAYKFSKIRHKNADRDNIKEDVRRILIFDTETEHFRQLTQNEVESFKFFLKKATDKRKEDKKTALLEYVSLGGAKE